MAQTHLVEVLKGVGLPEDQVKALTDLPEDTKDFKTDEYIAPVHTTIETKVKNDPKFYEGLNRENLPKEFLKTLETEQYGRAASIVRANMLKAVGLSDKDFQELGDEGKKIDIFTPAFVKKLSDGKVGDKELQAKLIEANQKIQELEANAPKLEEKYRGQYETQIKDFTLKSGILAQLASAQGLKAPAAFIVDKLTADLKNKYGFEVSDTTIELRQKDKPALKVLYDNGTKELTLALAIEQYLKEADLIEAKKTTTTTPTTVKTGDGGLKISGHVNDKMAKRIAEDAKNQS